MSKGKNPYPEDEGHKIQVLFEQLLERLKEEHASCYFTTGCSLCELIIRAEKRILVNEKSI
jgi:hypothetical protein